MKCNTIIPCMDNIDFALSNLKNSIFEISIINFCFLCISVEPRDGQESKAPKVLESVQCMSAADGSTVEFVCKVEGSPRPQITWFR